MTNELAPTVDRRRFLLGLAAASTAAAALPASAAPVENPKLIALANELPAVAAGYHAAYGAYREMHRRHKASTPLAPDEITEIGIGCPREVRQKGEVEMNSTLGYLYRKGEEHPRRIVRTSWDFRREIDAVRRTQRRAKKTGAVAEYLDADGRVAELKTQLLRVEAYEAAWKGARDAAHADHERLYPAREQGLQALADHVSAIMAEPDWTMEGLIIKAETLVEWGRVDKQERLYAHILGADWHSAIAASILRHGQGGAA